MSSTDTTEWSTSPGGSEHDVLLLLSFIFCRIFDLYKQGPICAITAGDSGSVPVT